jgi:iron(III) transport system permease protein
VGVAAQARGRTGGRGSAGAAGAACLLAAALVAGPLLVLPLSFLRSSQAWEQIAPELLPDALWRSVLLAGGVGTGTLVLGTALAVLVTFYDFPGRRTLEWGLVLPLAMPAYVLTFVLLGQYDEASVVQRVLRDVLGSGAQLPDLRTPGGAIAVLTLVLYPYVYLLVRSALVGQSPGLLEAARSLGHSNLSAIVRIALPLARPAIAAGTALAVMEALADFGAVNLLGYRALTDTIYRVWYGAFDRTAALQLGAVLLGLVLLLLALERISRSRGSVAQTAGRGQEVARRRLHGPRALVAAGLPALLLAVVFVAPVIQLVVWSVSAIAGGTFDSSLFANARNSVLLAFLAAGLAVGLALTIAYGVRLRASRPRVAGARAASIGYAVPGSVAAAAVFLVVDRVDGALGIVLTGTLLALLLAYLVRFTSLGLQTVEARLAAVPTTLDAAARSLGAGRGRVLSEVHLPLLAPGIATAALLVFVEVLKELPATVLLRPLGLDTLAIAVWEATKESLYETAAFPALLIVAVGLLPVVILVRLADTRTIERRD